MKQNKVLQVITILVSILLQIGLFLFVLTNIHTSKGTPFDTSILPQILQSYSLVTLSILAIGCIGYGGYYVKKHKQVWLTYIKENIINPLHKSLVIGSCIQGTNFCILIITILVNAQAEELRPHLDLLFNVVGITTCILWLSTVTLEFCFIDKDHSCFLDKGCKFPE